MFRAVSAWILGAAFLATVPVTGSGQCPCHIAHALGLRVPHLAPVSPAEPHCKCCLTEHDAPSAPDSEPLSHGTCNGPCEHGAQTGTVPTAPERSDPVRGEDGAAGPLDAVPAGAPAVCYTVVGEPVLGSQSGARLIRYSYAFRC